MKIPRKVPVAPYCPTKPKEPSKTLETLKSVGFDCTYMSLLEVVKRAREMGIKDGNFSCGTDEREYSCVLFGKDEYVNIDNNNYHIQMIDYKDLLNKYNKKKEAYDEEYAIYQKELKEYLEWNTATKIEEAKSLLRQHGETL